MQILILNTLNGFKLRNGGKFSMYNDDIFSILMAAEESMVKADLGVEDSYEAYAIESALESACYEDDSYGWDAAMEADEGSDAPKSFGDKIKAAGRWILDAIKGLFKKAGDLWHKITDWIMTVFKKKKSSGINTSNSQAQRTEKSEDAATTDITKPSTPKSVVNNRAIEMKKNGHRGDDCRDNEKNDVGMM